MSSADFAVLLPLILVAGGALAVLLMAAFARGLLPSLVVTLGVLGAALGLACASLGTAPAQVGAMLSLDAFSRFGVVLVLASAIVSALASWADLRRRPREGGDYFFLFLVATLGAVVLAAASSFATFFLGAELLGISLYAMIAWKREHAPGTEAAIRYLVLAGASSAFLLFGMALVYGATGSLALSAMTDAVRGAGIAAPVGLGLMLVGLGFKLAAVPFHMWTPDVYDGAPAPVTGFIAAVSKGATVVVLARAFGPALTGTPDGTPLSAAFPWVISAIATLSMFGGNILALRETNVKRILAYSSIAHVGYILVAFLAAGTDGLRAIAFYLVAYVASTLGAFAAVSAAGTDARDADSVDDYRGLAAKRPALAGAFTAMILSLAGLPLTAGFVGKFLLLRAGAGVGLWALAVVLAVNGAISIFYYLRIVASMFKGFSPHDGEPAAAPAPAGARLPAAMGIALAVLVLAVVVLGVYPAPLLGFFAF